MANDQIKIALLQYDIEWENKQANIDKIEQMVSGTEGADLIVLPEMFTTGFSMNISDCAEKMDGQTVVWMKQFAQNRNVAICGSIIIEENGVFYNRLIFVKPDGRIYEYDKRHLFTMGNEQNYYTPGNQRKIIEYKGFRILPLICYDLRFPVWSRNQNEYDLMIYVANWPAPRRAVWNTLLQARAIENQAYVTAVNCIGTDANQINYKGDSCFVDAKGKVTQTLPINTEGVLVEVFSLDSLRKFREKFPVLNDADQFEIK